MNATADLLTSLAPSMPVPTVVGYPGDRAFVVATVEELSGEPLLTDLVLDRWASALRVDQPEPCGAALLADVAGTVFAGPVAAIAHAGVGPRLAPDRVAVAFGDGPDVRAVGWLGVELAPACRTCDLAEVVLRARFGRVLAPLVDAVSARAGLDRDVGQGLVDAALRDLGHPAAPDSVWLT